LMNNCRYYTMQKMTAETADRQAIRRRNRAFRRKTRKTQNATSSCLKCKPQLVYFCQIFLYVRGVEDEIGRKADFPAQSKWAVPIQSGGTIGSLPAGGFQVGSGSFPKLKILYPNPRLRYFQNTLLCGYSESSASSWLPLDKESVSSICIATGRCFHTPAGC